MYTLPLSSDVTVRECTMQYRHFLYSKMHLTICSDHAMAGRLQIVKQYTHSLLRCCKFLNLAIALSSGNTFASVIRNICWQNCCYCRYASCLHVYGSLQQQCEYHLFVYLLQRSNSCHNSVIYMSQCSSTTHTCSRYTIFIDYYGLLRMCVLYYADLCESCDVST